MNQPSNRRLSILRETDGCSFSFRAPLWQWEEFYLIWDTLMSSCIRNSHGFASDFTIATKSSLRGGGESTTSRQGNTPTSNKVLLAGPLATHTLQRIKSTLQSQGQIRSKLKGPKRWDWNQHIIMHHLAWAMRDEVEIAQATCVWSTGNELAERYVATTYLRKMTSDN